MLPHVPKLILTGGWLQPESFHGFSYGLDPDPLSYSDLTKIYSDMILGRVGIRDPFLNLITGPSTAREVDAILSERLYGLSPVRHVQAEVGVLPRSFPPHGPKDGVYRVSGFLSEETGPK